MEELKINTRRLPMFIAITAVLAVLSWLMITTTDSIDGEGFIAVAFVSAFFIFMYCKLFFGSLIFKVNDEGIYSQMAKKLFTWDEIETVRFIKRNSFDSRRPFKRETVLQIRLKDEVANETISDVARSRHIRNRELLFSNEQAEITTHREYSIYLTSAAKKPEEIYELMRPYIAKYCPDQEFIGSGVGADGVIFEEISF